MKALKRILILTLCAMFIIGSTLIPVSAEEACDHARGLKTVTQLIDDGPNDSYCSYLFISWRWTCCGLTESTESTIYHDFIMTGPSWMTCTKCEYERAAK